MRPKGRGLNEKRPGLVTGSLYYHEQDWTDRTRHLTQGGRIQTFDRGEVEEPSLAFMDQTVIFENRTEDSRGLGTERRGRLGSLPDRERRG